MKKVNYLIVVILLSYSSYLEAAEHCVTNSIELALALDVADSNDEDDTIKIASGFYSVPQGGFEYVSLFNESNDIEISGGWSHSNGVCINQSTGFLSTVLDGNSNERVLAILTFESTNITLSNLSIINGSTNEVGAGIYATSGKLTLVNSFFASNKATDGAALFVLGGELHYIKNNIFTGNLNYSNGQDQSTILLQSNSETDLYFTNNTVLSNEIDGLNVNHTNVSSRTYIGNNILWDNGTTDVQFQTHGSTYFLNNNAGTTNGMALVIDNNISQEPNLESGLFNFMPAQNSPLIDVGRLPIKNSTNFENNWHEGDEDIEGNSRTQGNGIDIGAVESPHSDTIFINGFE